MISIGGSVFMASKSVGEIGYFVGAVMFSVALYSICLMNFSLYTGKIGFVYFDHTKKNLFDVAMCLLGNVIGCIVFGVLINLSIPSINQACNGAVLLKLEQSWYSALIRAFFCGVLMYVAVFVFKNKNSVLGIFICIPTFILSGFEHSIADMFYFSCALSFSFDSVLYLIIIIVGNSLGSFIIPAVESLSVEKNNEKN